MRDASVILKLVNALFVAFECPDDGCLHIDGVAFCLSPRREDLAFELLLGGVQLFVKRADINVKGADVDPLRLLLFQDSANSCSKPSKNFALLIDLLRSPVSACKIFSVSFISFTYIIPHPSIAFRQKITGENRCRYPAYH